MTKTLPESDVLTPRDPTITDSDDWPEFRLNDATVTLPNGEPVSLLVASEHDPVTVTGRLEAVPKALAHTCLLPSKQSTATIEVSEVRSFAYGAYADGSVEIWAAGKAGWFIVCPSRAYRSLYAEMTEGVNILFFVVDAYQKPRKSGKGKNAMVLPDYTAQELFEKYAVEVMGREKGAADAAQRIYRHRQFLLSSMMAGKEGMVWGRNALYLHLCRKFPGDTKSMRERLAGPRKEEAQSVTRARGASLDSISTSSSLKRKRGRPPKDASVDVISIGSSSVDTSTPKEPAQTSAPAPTDSTKPKPNPSQTRRGRSNTKPLGPPPPPPPADETPEIQDSQLATPANEESDSDAHPRHKHNHNHKRKSALRLKPSRPSKGPPKGQKSGKAPTAAHEDDAEEEEEEEEEDELEQGTRSPSAPNGNGNGKRKRPSARERKRTHRRSKHDVDEGISMPTSPSSNPPRADEIPPTPTSDTAPFPPHLLNSPDPLQEDTHLCPLLNCTHKIFSSSTPLGQRLIREHYALHAYDDDERVRLVRGLEQPSLPAGHLMGRVREVVAREGFPRSRVAGPGFPGTRFPEPIRGVY